MHMRTTRDLRRGNLKKLLRLIYFHEPISRLDLSKRSGFSPATVTNLVNQMIEQGLIEQAGLEELMGGRPREILRIRRDYGHFIGVEVAETHIHAELFDLKLQSLTNAHHEITSETNSPELVADFVERSIRELQAASGVSTESILGVGVGLPGVVHSSEGVSVYAPNWGWKNVPFVDMFRERLDVPLQIDNGFQGQALAEALFGAGRGVADLAVVLIGTGVAAGLITRHQLWRGVSNSAGEWGHTCIDPDGPLCRCGKRGCVEAFTGGPAIIRRLREEDANSALLNGSEKEIVAAVCAAAMQADPVAVVVLDDVTRHLAIGIGNLVTLLNPARVVVGGWCGNLLAPYALPILRHEIDRYAFSEASTVVEIRASAMGVNGVSLGAGCLVLEDFLAGELLALFDSPASA